MRRLAVAVLAAAVCVTVAVSALAITARGGGKQSAERSGGPRELKAFRRPAEAGDAVPRRALGPLARRFGAVVASRRIATASGFRGRATIYLLRLKRNYTCLIQLDRGAAGGGCSPSRDFLSPGRAVAAGAGDGFFHGVAANEIARVAFVDPHGRWHAVRLTRDGGFIYVCRARNGCINVIRAVNGYDRRGRLVSHERW